MPDGQGAPGAAAARAPATGRRDTLVIDNVRKSFGGLRALRGANPRSARRRDPRAPSVPNGCGKTTLINMITGHLPLTSGHIALDGATISGLPAHRIARAGWRAPTRSRAPSRTSPRWRTSRMCALRRRHRRRRRRDALARLLRVGPSRAGNPGRAQPARAQGAGTGPRAGRAPAHPAARRGDVGTQPAEVDTAIRLVRQIRSAQAPPSCSSST